MTQARTVFILHSYVQWSIRTFVSYTCGQNDKRDFDFSENVKCNTTLLLFIFTEKDSCYFDRINFSTDYTTKLIFSVI